MALVLGISAPTIAAPKAASVKLVMVEVEDHELMSAHQLQPTTIEPGGLFVPPDVAKEWLDLGLLPGDVIRFANGSPTTDHFYVADGVTVLDIVRNGKPVIIHIMAHGKSSAQVDLSADQFKELVDATTRGPIATPVRIDDNPSGVRMVDMLVPLYIEAYGTRSSPRLPTSTRTLPTRVLDWTSAPYLNAAVPSINACGTNKAYAAVMSMIAV
jgi:hypothetical protein